MDKNLGNLLDPGPDQPIFINPSPGLNNMKVMKVAAAMACISMKPPDMTAREYIEQLCVDFQMSQQRWKEKCLAMETELLHLKQAALLKSGDLLMSKGHAASTHDAVMSTQNSVSSSVQNGITSQRQDGTPASIEIDIPDPVLDTSSVSLQKVSVTESIEKHTQFLQSLNSLKTINKQLETDKEVIVLFQKTITKSLLTIKQCIAESKIVSIKVMQNCLQQVNQAMNVLPDCNLLPQVTEVCTVLIDRVLCVNCDKREDKECYVELIQVLVHPALINKVFATVIEKIEAFSQHLRQTNQGTASLNTKLYENMHYVFLILEHFIKLSHRSGHFTLFEDCASGLKSHLDNSLLHLSSKFPLYAHVIWKMQYMIG